MLSGDLSSFAQKQVRLNSSLEEEMVYFKGVVKKEEKDFHFNWSGDL
jgi:hypothetical protein